MMSLSSRNLSFSLFFFFLHTFPRMQQYQAIRLLWVISNNDISRYLLLSRKRNKGNSLQYEFLTRSSEAYTHQICNCHLKIFNDIRHMILPVFKHPMSNILAYGLIFNDSKLMSDFMTV